MRRIHFIEFHDQPWFPSSIRDYITGALQFGFDRFRVYAPIAPLLQRALDSTGSETIVDMCSGGGGPWLDLSKRLASSKSAKDSGALQIYLTDKYPNLEAFRKIGAASEGRILSYPESVDATNVPRELKGLRTMFSTFHHFRPTEARAILQDAVDAREGVGIFEVARRAPSTIAMTLVFVLMLFVGTLWMRPFRWARLFWTYLIPVIPFVLLFDGVVSCLRTYKPTELREIAANLNASDYRWEIGERSVGKATITYLIGYLVSPANELV
jgi:hypothetical protein